MTIETSSSMTRTTTPPTNVVELLVSGSGGRGRRLRLAGDRWYIGSSPDAAIRVEGFRVRGIHAELFIDRGKIFARGVDAEYLLNGRVERGTCSIGLNDRIEIGGYRLQLARLELLEAAVPHFSPSSGGRSRIAFSQRMRVALEQPSSSADQANDFERSQLRSRNTMPGHTAQVSETNRQYVADEVIRTHEEPIFDSRSHHNGNAAEQPVRFIANELPVLTIETLREVVMEATTALQNRLNGFEEQLKSSVLEVAKDSVQAYDRIRESQAELEGEKEKLQTGVAQLETRVAELEEAIVQSHREVQAERQANRVALGQVQTLEATIATLRQEHASQRDELEQQAAALQKHVASLSDALEAEKVVNQESREQSTTTSHNLREALQQVQSELALAQAELNEARIELQRVQEQWSVAEQQRQAAAAEIERLRALLDEARNEISEYHSAKESETKTVDGLQLRLRAVQHELETLKQEHQELIQNRDELQSIVANLQAQLESTQSAANQEVETPVAPKLKTESLSHSLTQTHSGAGLTVSRMSRLAQIEASLRQSKKEQETESLQQPASHAPAIEDNYTDPMQSSSTHSVAGEMGTDVGAAEDGLYGGATMQLPSGGFEQPPAALPAFSENQESDGAMDGATAMLNLPPLDSNESWYGDASVPSNDDDLPTWWTRGPSVAIQEESLPEVPASYSSGNLGSMALPSSVPPEDAMAEEASPENLSVTASAPAPRAESAAEILARMGHKFDEEEGSQPPIPPRPMPINPNISQASAQAGFTAATAGQENDSSHEEDEASIEAYMNGLLARMQGRDPATSAAGSSSPKTASAKPTQPVQPVAKTETSVFRTKPKSEPIAETGDIQPRVAAPEKTRDMAAMRELANSTARIAIAQSVKKRAVTAALTRIVISCICFVTGAVLLFTSNFSLSVQTVLAAICFAATAIWGVDAVATSRRTLKQNNQEANAQETQAVSPDVEA